MSAPIYTRQDDTGRTIYSNLPRYVLPKQPAAAAPPARYTEDNAVDPMIAAKEFLAKPDFFDSERSNSDAANEYLAPKPAPQQAETGGLPSALRALLPSVPTLAGTAAVAGANLLAPEIAWPAEALAGGAAGFLADRAQGGEHPIAGTVEGAFAGLPIGKPLGWAGSKIKAAGAAASAMPWFGRMVGGRMLGGEMGEVAATVAPPIAKGVGGAMERGGAAMGEDSIGGKVAKWARSLLGQDEQAGLDSELSSFYQQGGRRSSEVPGFSYNEPPPTRPTEDFWPTGETAWESGAPKPPTPPVTPKPNGNGGGVTINGKPLERGGMDKMPESFKKLLGLGEKEAGTIPDMATLGEDALKNEKSALYSKIENRPEGTSFNFDTGKVEPTAALPDQRPLIGYSSLGEPIHDFPNVAQSHLKMPEKGTKDLATELLQRTTPGAKVTSLKTYPKPSGEDSVSKALRQRAHIAAKGYTMPAFLAGLLGLSQAGRHSEESE